VATDTTPPAVDHRRATALRNAAAILDASERLLGRNATLTMAAIAAEAGVSRPTLYAHYKTIGDIVEAAVERSVRESLAAVEAARPNVGPAPEALLRMAEASWDQLARYQGLTRRAGEYLSAGALHRTHKPLMAHMHALVERGRVDGAFRTDLPADWLVTIFYALVHAADDHAAAHVLERDEALELLTATVSDLFLARRGASSLPFDGPRGESDRRTVFQGPKPTRQGAPDGAR
jgi:TetR/AcrR family transcriptional regulator, mexCD-oprJ operon repressor